MARAGSFFGYEDSLVLELLDSAGLLTDRGVRIVDYFRGTTNTTRIDVIEFDDVTWTLADVQAKLLRATEGSDTLAGMDFVDAIDGLGGDDSINGMGGDDVLRRCWQ